MNTRGSNESGFLDYAELRDALRHYGFPVSAVEAADIVLRYDDHPNGKLGLGEFSALIDDLEEGEIRTSRVGRELHVERAARLQNPTGWQPRLVRCGPPPTPFPDLPTRALKAVPPH